MQCRRILLRVMLWSLGLAAVTGVLAVLFKGGQLTFRVVTTGFLTAVASGLLLPISALTEREKTRTAGLLGVTGVILEFLLALALVWEVPRQVLGSSWEEQVALTMVLGAVAVLAGMYFLRLQQEVPSAVAGKVAVVAILLTFVLYMCAVWAPRPHSHDANWWETGNVILVIGGMAVVSLLGLGAERRRPWRWGGIAAGGVAGLMWLIDIWIGTGSDLGYVVCCVLLSGAAVTAHANLSLLCTITDTQRWVRWGTIAASLLTACLLDVLAIDDKFTLRIDDDLYARFAAAAVIAAGCGTLALFVLAILNRRGEAEALSPELSELIVICPRCRKKQTLPVGLSACTGCGLRISVCVEEPRCPQCDYLLYGALSERCPECGMELAAEFSRGAPRSSG